MTNKKPWAGRFNEPTDAFVEAFTASVNFDRRLYKYDIAGSIAHAEMLAEVAVLTDKERDSIVAGLKEIEQEIDGGNFAWSIELEDVHMNIEARLIDRIGEVGKKLHTGRSRNDQVATDMRLFLRDAVDAIGQSLQVLQKVLLDVAECEQKTIMPGFTHLQIAQPVSFGHHMLAWFEMLDRDAHRFAECRQRINVLPLGAAALAGTTYPIDRHVTASKLGFDKIAENSLDAVSDRDFAIEFVATAATLMMHLSRFSEELVLWASAQFNFVDLGDAFCTGSSIMPQKKNPDVPELVRGKSGRVYGHLVSLLTIMKAQPLAYNKDNQEDKAPLFDTVDTVLDCLQVYTGMIAAMRINSDAMTAAAEQGYATATDLADYLVGKGLTFRDAHEVVGQVVQHCIAEQLALDKLELSVLQGFSDSIEQDVYKVLSLSGSVAARNHLGGTAFDQVSAAIQRAKKRIDS